MSRKRSGPKPEVPLRISKRLALDIDSVLQTFQAGKVKFSETAPKSPRRKTKGRKAKTTKTKDTKGSGSEEYLKTLKVSAPTPDSDKQRRKKQGDHELEEVRQKPTGFNAQEDEFIGDHAADMKLPDSPKNPDHLFLGDDVDDIEDVDDDDDDDGGAEDAGGDNASGDNTELIIQDGPSISSRSSNGNADRSSGAVNKAGSRKVVLADFPFRKLPLLAKRCTRMATCVVDMFPENAMFAFDMFSNQLKELQEEGRAFPYVAALEYINADPDKRDDLVRFMGYGTSAVRLDVGREARVRTAQYFGFGGMSSEDLIASVSWLLKGRKFHNHKVDLPNRTNNEAPFKSPLLGLLLRGYFIDGNPKQDKLLISYLKRQKFIPIPLIAMVTSLIGHSIQEYASGMKVEHSFSVGNLSANYQSIITTLKKLREHAPDYLNHVQTFLYKEMMTSGPETVPVQTYNYSALNALALQFESDNKENFSPSQLNNPASATEASSSATG